MKIKMMTIAMSIILLTFFICAGSARADSLVTGPGGGMADLFGADKATRVGDILTVIFKESTTANQSAKGKVKNTYNNGVKSGEGLLDFFLGAGMSGGEKTDVESNTTQSHSLYTTMSVTVVDVMPGGNLKIEGTRSVEVNHETQKLTISGIVRPRDIAYDNTIQSTRIANMAAKVNGLPLNRSTKQRRGGVLRWVWGLLF